MMVLCVAVMLLVACREDKGLVGDPQPVTPFRQPQATTMPGCDTSQLENWYEVVAPNAQAFRDESFGYAALSPEAVGAAIDRLSDLRDQVSSAATPECMLPTQAGLQALLDGMIDSFLAYQVGRIDQGALIGDVTQRQAVYDAEIKPALEAALALLNERFSSGS